MTAPTSSTGGVGIARTPTSSTKNTHLGGDVCVAACFARTRGWVAGSPNLVRESQGILRGSIIDKQTDFAPY